LGSGALRRATPYSVSMPTIFGTATTPAYRRTGSAASETLGRLTLGSRSVASLSSSL
jgi:hypothetical protein